MAKTLGEFLHELVKKAGHNPDDEAVKNFLTNGELVKIEMPDNIAGAIDKGLISIKEAKNNHPDIKPHYTQLSLKNIDAILDRMIEESDLDENTRAEILTESSTYKRLPLLLTKVKELETKKSLSGKSDKEAIQKQIDELHRQIRTEKDRADAAQKDFEGKLKDYKLNTKKSTLFQTYKTIYDELDSDIKNTTLLNVLEKKLRDQQLVITFDENEELVLLRKDGTNFFGDNNQQINPKQFVEQLLSETKLLKTAQTVPTTPNVGSQMTTLQGGVNTTSGQPFVANQQQQNGSGTSALRELLRESQSDLEKSMSIQIPGQ